MDDASGTKDYSAHIYVAPIYEDYCFVNFHELAYAVSSTSNLLTRKLVILGSDGTENVLISDVVAPATDTIRRIFRGWQYRANGSWISVQTIDNHNNAITRTIDVTEDIDLYPYFQEGRWLYFNVGDSGNGAKYVPAQFELAEFNDQTGESSVGGVVTSLPITERAGYDFGGWQVITDNSDPDNPVMTLVTDADGNFLSSVNISMNETYKDNDGNEQTGVAYTIHSGQQGGQLTIKYPLSYLTFYAKWNEKANSKVTVVVWKQKVTDDKNAVEADRTYDYYALDSNVLPSTIENVASGQTLAQLKANATLDSKITKYESLATNNSTKNDFTGFHYGRTEMSDTTVKGDGSTVLNVYYDRNLMQINFYRNNYIISNFSTYYPYTPTTSNSGKQYGFINGTYTQIYYVNSNWRETDNNNGTIYTGQRFTRGNRFEGYQWIGLYGQSFSQNGYLWENVSGYSWNEKSDGSGTGQTLLTAFTQTANPYSLYCRGSSGNNYIYHLRQKVDGKYSNVEGDGLIEAAHMSSSNGTFYFSNKYNGFTVNSYDTIFKENGGANPVSEDDSASVTYPIYVYHSRNSYTLTFNYNYPVATGFTNKTKDIPGVPYQWPLDEYDYYSITTDESNPLYDPDYSYPNNGDAVWPSDSEIPDHYEFQGWYEDAAGTKRFNFDSNMPAADKIIYGKWEPIYYTVSVDPNGGVINHINYDEPTDGSYLTFYLSGLSSETGAAWDAAKSAVGNDISWVAALAATGSGHNTSQSTYFSAQYGTAIGEYDLECSFVEYDGTETDAAAEDKTVYYYVNMGFNDTSGMWGLHADLRNALYLTAEQLEAYYKYCLAAKAWHDVARPNYYDGTLPSTFEEFKDLYVKKNGDDFQLYTYDINSYAFVAWYKVVNGVRESIPYSFANAIEGEIALQADWRRTGNYYLAYDPVYVLTEGGSSVVINGKISAWTDPANSNVERYNDGALTTLLQQPTGISVGGQNAEDQYHFRGWRIVKYLGQDENNQAIYQPYNNNYYDQAAPFTIDAHYADENDCIHIQAVYQAINVSDRRPEIANLTLNTNGGYLTDGTNAITGNESVDITAESGLNGVGTVVEDPESQSIVIGDMQSNDAVHLLRFAVTPGTLGDDYTNVSKNYFKHNNGYLLIGFDEGSDYSLEDTSDTGDDLKTGQAYVPTYPADSVISVQRTDEKTLYAVWEPMVYVTFTNHTKQPVSFDLAGTGESMSIVNKVTGAFGREKFTNLAITLAAAGEDGDIVKVVMPKGAGQNFTISGTNASTAQLLSITSKYHDDTTGNTTAGPYRSSGATFDLSDTLHDDPDGVFVYFDGVDTIFYNLNDKTPENTVASWTDTERTGSSYQTVLDSASLIYVDEAGEPYQPVDFTATPTTKATKPSDPTRSGYIFVGWTASKEAAECDLTAYTLPGTDSANYINNLAVIKNSLLWDFNTEISEGMTLYAVWGQTVQVIFNLNSDYHTWMDPDTTDYYIKESHDNRVTYTVTLSKGDIVKLPVQPILTNYNQYLFYRWITNNEYETAYVSDTSTIDADDIYTFGTPVLGSINLYTSWIEADHIFVTVSKTVANTDGSALTDAQKDKDFTFTALITTATYRLSVKKSTDWWGNVSWTRDVIEDTTEESQTISLKHEGSSTLPLYFKSNASTGDFSDNGTYYSVVFFQSVRIKESSDPDYSISVSVNGGTPTVINGNTEITVTTMSTAPANVQSNNNGWSFSQWSSGGIWSTTYYNYTLKGTATYANNANVPLVFTNTRDKTDVTVTKTVTLDDYLSGDEAFTFTATYKNSSNQTVNPPALPGYENYSVSGDTASFTLKDGESFILRGVPIGGSVTVTENAPGWKADSSSTANGTTTSGAESITLANAPADGSGAITFTNTRVTYDVDVKNKVLSEDYGNKTKGFVYTATLWNGNNQTVFPSNITSGLSPDRKTLTFSLKDGETQAIEKLPGGYKLVVTQTEDSDYVTAVGLNDDTQTESLSYAIENLTASAEINFTNTLKTGDYKITKNVQLPAGVTLPDGTDFTFTAKLLKTAVSTDAVAISDAIKTMAEGNGATVDGNIITFTLVDKGSISLTGLPVGYFLQVTETNKTGYAAYVNGIRTNVVTQQIAEGGTNSDINFINREAGATLKIQKVDEDEDKVNDTSIPVPSAKFRLFRMVNGEETAVYTDLISNNEGWLSNSEAGGSNHDLLTLEDGTYYLREDEAPPVRDGKGYFTMENGVTIPNTEGEKKAAVVIQITDTSGVKSVEYSLNGTDFTEVDGVEDENHIPIYSLSVTDKAYYEVTVTKKLEDTFVSGTQLFSFNYSYEYKNETKEGNFELKPSGSASASTVLQIPVGSKNLTVTENIDAEIKDMPVSSMYSTVSSGRWNTDNDKTEIDDAEQENGNIFKIADEVARAAAIEFTNTRKMVDITVHEVIMGGEANSFPFIMTVLDGDYALPTTAIPIKYNKGTSDETSGNLTTDNNGQIDFTIENEKTVTVSIPVGARVTLSQETSEYAVFMRESGGTESLLQGKSDAFRFPAPTKETTIHVFHIPAICKVTGVIDKVDEETGKNKTDDALLYYEYSYTYSNNEQPINLSLKFPAIFSTIKEAFDTIGSFFIKNGAEYIRYDPDPNSKKPYKIQMLTDYKVPDTDVVTVPTGYNMTFTTARTDDGSGSGDGYFFRRTGEFDGEGKEQFSQEELDRSVDKAVLRRETGSKAAFFTVSDKNETEVTNFTISDLIIDGAGVSLNAKGGCLTAYNAKVTIENCVICRFNAQSGGAVYNFRDSSLTYSDDDSMTVKSSIFDDCNTSSKGNGNGGGAINTTAKTLQITGSTFQDCSAIWQGGAVYHYGAHIEIKDDKEVLTMDATGAKKVATLTNCTFNNCSARAGGGMEADVGTVSLTGCTFTNCKAKNMPSANGTNGGGLNSYSGDIEKDTTQELTMTLNNCQFYGCTAVGSGEGKGGGLRSAHKKNTLTNCTFDNDPSNADNHCSAKIGGGAAFTNGSSTATLSDCTIQNCTATTSGGGIYSEGSITLLNNVLVTGNKLTNDSVGDAAGLYLANGKSLILGSDTIDLLQNVKVTNNKTTGTNGTDKDSNIRLSLHTNGFNSPDSIVVKSNLDTNTCAFGVVNPVDKLFQFGTSEKKVEGIAYQSEAEPDKAIIKADVGKLYGVYEDSSVTKIIWDGEQIVCRITNSDGELLATGSITEPEPAVYSSLLGAFAAFGGTFTKYDTAAEGDNTPRYIEMLVLTHPLPGQVSVSTSGAILRTAPISSDDTANPNIPDDYKLITQESGVTCRIYSGGDNSMFKLHGKTLTLENIWIGGTKLGDTVTFMESGADGAVFDMKDGATLTMNSGAVIGYIKTQKNGGAIKMASGTNKLIINDGAKIMNCSAVNGGAILVTGGTQTIEGSNNTIEDRGCITECWSSTNGGAIYVNGGSLTIENCVISNNHAGGIGGGAIRVENNAYVKINSGSILGNYVSRNGAAYGGAINIKKGTVEISGGTISGNYVNTTKNSSADPAMSGAIHVSGEKNDSGNLIITGGTIIGNYAQNNQNNTVVAGGAISLRGSNATATISGGTIVGNYVQNTAKTENAMGAGIYVSRNARLNIQGDPLFDDSSVNKYGNCLKTPLTNATNGGDDYIHARQDIYIAAADPTGQTDGDKNAPKLVVSESINATPGSIWVWMENGNADHVSGDQIHERDAFATINTGVTNPGTLSAFRNARTDADTTGSTRSGYLMGVQGAQNTDGEVQVIWGTPVTGSRRVILRKVADGSYNALSGAVLTLHKASGAVVPGVVSPTPASGIIFIGELEYGSYYIEETTAPAGYYTPGNDEFFSFIVSEQGISRIIDGEEIFTNELRLGEEVGSPPGGGGGGSTPSTPSGTIEWGSFEGVDDKNFPQVSSGKHISFKLGDTSLTGSDALEWSAGTLYIEDKIEENESNKNLRVIIKPQSLVWYENQLYYYKGTDDKNISYSEFLNYIQSSAFEYGGESSGFLHLGGADEDGNATNVQVLKKENFYDSQNQNYNKNLDDSTLQYHIDSIPHGIILCVDTDNNKIWLRVNAGGIGYPGFSGNQGNWQDVTKYFGDSIPWSST